VACICAISRFHYRRQQSGRQYHVVWFCARFMKLHTDTSEQYLAVTCTGICTRSRCLLLTLTISLVVPRGRYLCNVMASLSTPTIRSIVPRGMYVRKVNILFAISLVVPCGRYVCKVKVFAADASKNYTSMMCEILYVKLPLSLFHA
jgi:hypothetical protein